jgi:hypothetical protein
MAEGIVTAAAERHDTPTHRKLKIMFKGKRKRNSAQLRARLRRNKFNSKKPRLLERHAPCGIDVQRQDRDRDTREGLRFC